MPWKEQAGQFRGQSAQHRLQWAVVQPGQYLVDSYCYLRGALRRRGLDYNFLQRYHFWHFVRKDELQIQIRGQNFEDSALKGHGADIQRYARAKSIHPEAVHRRCQHLSVGQRYQILLRPSLH